MSPTTHQSTPGDVMCAETTHPQPRAETLFPPADADAETRQAWLAASPWPEVVFASV